MKSYEIRTGDRVVSHVRSYTPRHAVTDFLRSLGCQDHEIDAIGSDEVAWRGAVYTAVVPAETASASNSQPDH
jgi:hypothetical protein